MAGFEAQAPMGRYSVNQTPGYETWRGSTTFGNNAGVDRSNPAAIESLYASQGADMGGGASASTSGFNLPPDILDSMIGKGNDSINQAQDQALMGARNRAAGSGFSVSGGVNAAEDQIRSDYASKRAGNERELRIADALNAQKGAVASAGFGSSGGAGARSGGFAPVQAPQDTGLAEGINKSQQLSLMMGLRPSAVGGGQGQDAVDIANKARQDQKQHSMQQQLNAVSGQRQFGSAAFS